ncbi:MAG: hypothetical protein LBT25_12545 [Candidatus Symbiothrix sp.]|jgi:hypothetical protein|nr:hypothetical protein [Candidatus Symbiothrix sp.]
MKKTNILLFGMMSMLICFSAFGQKTIEMDFDGKRSENHYPGRLAKARKQTLRICLGI